MPRYLQSIFRLNSTYVAVLDYAELLIARCLNHGRQIGNMVTQDFVKFLIIWGGEKELQEKNINTMLTILMCTYRTTLRSTKYG